MKPSVRNLIVTILGAGGILMASGVVIEGTSLFWSRIIVPAQKKALWTSTGYKQTETIAMSVVEREYPTVYHRPFPHPYLLREPVPQSPKIKEMYIPVEHWKTGKTRDQDVLTDRMVIVLENEGNSWRFGAWSVQRANGHTIPDSARIAFSFRPDPDWIKR